MSWDAASTGRRSHQQTCSYPIAPYDVKILFDMALCQTTGLFEDLPRPIGQDRSVPDFSTLSHRQKILAVSIPYRASKGPLHLLIDSTALGTPVTKSVG